MTSLESCDKYVKIAIIILLIGLGFYLIYPYISSLTFGFSGSIISICWLAENIKRYGINKYRSNVLGRYIVLIILFLMSLKAELLGVLLFLLGYLVGQWFMIFKIWKEKK
ncbi:MAG: hypothetical protein NZ841_08400 [Dictyoglomus sp.]|nr:hypothetical protein [Dictyoglomus sp.]MCX7845508.1 hypothetical protein [Dictyoglomaceae bacterium]MDW8189303.1 hypothetical protein [Dictyoglomus sp.]